MSLTPMPTTRAAGLKAWISRRESVQAKGLLSSCTHSCCDAEVWH